jgi:uncharacterized protein YndB with AHSA1/START domain
MAASFDISLAYAFDAPPTEVFDGFLDMYGPDGPDWIVDSALDLRVGGAWTVTFRPPGVEEFREERTLTEIERPNVLGYRVVIGAGGGQSTEVTVRFLFEATGPGTRLLFSESGFPTQGQRDDFAAAWPYVFAELATRLAG